MKKKYVKNCYITLKYGLLKSYYFSNEFIKENEELFKELENIWDEMYKKNVCVFGAVETNKDNKDLKERLFNIIEKFFNLNIKISNGFTNKTYTSIEQLKKYIIEEEF